MAGGQENYYPGVQYGVHQRQQTHQAPIPGDSYYYGETAAAAAGGGGGGGAQGQGQQGYLPLPGYSTRTAVNAIPLSGNYGTTAADHHHSPHPPPKHGCCHCRKDPNGLPFCGLGYGWFLFILGFLCLSLPWYIGAFLFFFHDHDYKEREGLKACTIVATVFLLLSSSMYILW